MSACSLPATPQIPGNAAGAEDQVVYIDYEHQEEPQAPQPAPVEQSEAAPETDFGTYEEASDDPFINEYLIKRNLILNLVANEIEFLSAWHNPMSLEELTLEEEEIITEWQQRPVSDESWVATVRLAWRISPSLAVHLPPRFKNTDVLRDELCFLVQDEPNLVMHIPEALQYFVTPTSLNESRKHGIMLTWAPVSPVKALTYFSGTYKPDPITAQYSVRIMSACPPEVLLFYIAQIVQAVRHDSMKFIQNFIITSSTISQVIMHQFIWNMKTNMYRDEDGQEEDKELIGPFKSIINTITDQFSGTAKLFYETEDDLFTKVTANSGVLRYFHKDAAIKDEVVQSHLSNIKAVHGCYLPSSPEAVIIDIEYTAGKPKQSAVKAKVRAKFKVRSVGIEKVEQVAKAKYTSPLALDNVMNSIENRDIHSIEAIFKVGDDLRQDMLALQIIELLRNVFLMAGLDVFLFPYRVVATSPGCGIIECVPDSTSRDQMDRQTGAPLYEYFINKFGDESTKTFMKARACFIKSMAAYSVATFLLQIKDRHNGNILIDAEGHYIHIDFGFLFESSPEGNIGFEPDIKLTEEIVMLMGQDKESDTFKWYAELCIRCYLAIRAYREDVLTLVSLMQGIKLPCFRSNPINLLRARFMPQASDRDAAAFMMKIIDDCYDSGTKASDTI